MSVTEHQTVSHSPLDLTPEAKPRPFYQRHPILVAIFSAVVSYLIASSNSAFNHGLAVTFENASDTAITSIKLDFGNVNTQSSIQSFRINSGETRTLLLNHPAGAGFNVKVSYADGRVREFCALKGDERTQPKILLTP